MTDKFFRYISLLFAALALLPAAGCSSSTSDEPEAPEHHACMMELYVNLGTRADDARSRAGATDGYEYVDGTGLENYIDQTDFNVYLFTTDGTLITCLTDPAKSGITDFRLDRAAESLYRMSFRVDGVLKDAETVAQSFKIMMLANWGTYPTVTEGATKIDDILAGSEAGFSSGTLDKDSNRMPFYGVQSYENVSFDKDNQKIHEKVFFLLRAWAKIDVHADEDSYSEISKVTLKRYNGRFYKAPLKNPDYTDADGRCTITTLSLPDNPYQWEQDKDIELTQGEDGHFTIYVPEYRNVGRADSETRAELLLEYEDGVTHTVEFKYYSDPPAGSAKDDFYDLRRNYWYEFIVKRTNEVTVNVCIEPYTVKTLDPEFGI